MKAYLILFILCFPLYSWSQMTPVRGAQAPMVLQQPLPFPQDTNAVSEPSVSRSAMDAIIGTTNYDFQSNASIMNRLINHGDGRLTGVWTMSVDDASFSNRGTGYNHFDGNQWGESPSERIEEVRTGWPSIVVTEDEKELIVSHDFAQNTLVTSRRVAGDIEWDFSSVDTDVPIGILWPQMASGRDNMVHLIAMTSLNGTYQGVEGHLLYYRSSDAGLTWEVKDFIVPGLDSTLYRDYRQSDSYKIAARGNTIAIAKFSFWEDVVVFRSDDNGDTWTKSVIYDFPLENYIEEDGYSVDQVPTDPFAPTEMAIYSAGNSGNIIVDHNMDLHLFFNSLYVSDEILGNNTLEYFPCTSGIAYWKESMGENTFRIIANAVDADDSGFLDFDCVTPNFSHRNSSLTTAPNAGVDQDNNLYLTYTGVTENYITLTAFPAIQHNQHIYAVRSEDGGDTWGEPVDLIKVTNPSIIETVNADFPTIALDVDENMHILYQQDFEPGNVIADGDPPSENSMVYLSFLTGLFNLVSTEEFLDGHSQLSLSPNPAGDISHLDIDPDWSRKAVLTLHDVQGRILHTENNSDWMQNEKYELPISTLEKGIYIVQVKDGSATSIGKLILN